MFAILAIIAFLAAFFEHWGKVTVAAPFDFLGLVSLGLAFLAIHLLRVHGGFGSWRQG